jgi:hypothetical protein
MTTSSSLVSRLLSWTLHGFIFLLPLISNGGDTLLGLTVWTVTTAFLLFLWLLRGLQEKEWLVMRGWLYGLLFLFGIGALLSSVFSAQPMEALLGTRLSFAWSFSGILSGIFFAWFIAQEIRTVKQMGNLFYAFAWSSLVLQMSFLLALVSVRVPFIGQSFIERISPFGSLVSFAFFLLLFPLYPF